MRISDLSIEVRNKSLARVADIPPELWSDVTIRPEHSGAGFWSLSLPAEQECAQLLALPGAGIVVTGPVGVGVYGTIFSGSVEEDVDTQSTSDVLGTITFQGSADTALLWDPLILPNPAQEPDAQTSARYDVTGAAETVLHDLTGKTIGPSALASQRGALADRLTMGTNLGRGPTVTSSTRFDVLGDELVRLARLAGFGFRVVQSGTALVFETYVPQDLSKLVRLDVQNDTLAKASSTVTVPRVTRVLPAGQGEGADRTILVRTTADSLAAETAWGRKRFLWKDRRDTDDPTLLEQAGDEELADGGFTRIQTIAIPADDLHGYGVSWREGDRITVTLRGVEYPATTSAAVIRITKDGVLTAAKIGES